VEADRFVNALTEAISYLEIFGGKPASDTPDLKIRVEAIGEILIFC
jgi:hypothetical protein